MWWITRVYIRAFYKLQRSDGEVKYESQKEANWNAVIEQQSLNSLWLLWALVRQEGWTGSIAEVPGRVNKHLERELFWNSFSVSWIIKSWIYSIMHLFYVIAKCAL